MIRRYITRSPTYIYMFVTTSCYQALGASGIFILVCDDDDVMVFVAPLVMLRACLHSRTWKRFPRPSVRPSSSAAAAISAAAEPFLSGSSGLYVEQMFEAWSQDPSSVHKVGHMCMYVYVYVHEWILCFKLLVY